MTSLRTLVTETLYREHKIAGLTLGLRDEPVLLASNHWNLIKNRYPYDGVFAEHDMLIPTRDFAFGHEMTADEFKALRKLLASKFCEKYDIFFENSLNRRSERGLYHLHLACYYPKREDFKL